MKPNNLKVGQRWRCMDEKWHKAVSFGRYFDVLSEGYKPGIFVVKWELGREYEATSDPGAWSSIYELDEVSRAKLIIASYE